MLSLVAPPRFRNIPSASELLRSMFHPNKRVLVFLRNTRHSRIFDRGPEAIRVTPIVADNLLVELAPPPAGSIPPLLDLASPPAGPIPPMLDPTPPVWKPIPRTRGRPPVDLKKLNSLTKNASRVRKSRLGQKEFRADDNESKVLSIFASHGPNPCHPLICTIWRV